MKRQGVLVDAVSTGEVLRAQRVGFPVQGQPHPIVYTADIFDREALQLVVDKHIHVNVGSPDMIRQLGQVAPGREITFRINPGFGHGHSAKTNTGGDSSKHGIWHEQLADCLELARKYKFGGNWIAYAYRFWNRFRTSVAGLPGDGAGSQDRRSFNHDH